MSAEQAKDKSSEDINPASASGSKKSLAQTGFTQAFDVGKTFEFYGRPVTLMSLNGCRGHIRTHESNLLMEVELGELSAINESVAREQFIDLAQVDEETLERAAAVQKVVEKIIANNITAREDLNEFGKTINLKWRQLQRLVRAYRGDGTLTSLIPKRAGPMLGLSKLSIGQSRIVSEEIAAAKAKSTQISLDELRRSIKKRCVADGLKVPAKSTIDARGRAEGLQLQKRRRIGVSATKDQEARNAGIHTVTELFEEIQIDHTPVDLLVLDDTRRYVLGRPWLTLVMEICSRAILGFCISFDAPCLASVARALSMSVVPKLPLLHRLGLDEFGWNAYGIARRCLTDRATEFRSDTFKAACRKYGIEPVFRPRGQKHWGGHIERLIGTMMGRLHLLPGTTFSNAKLRRGYRAEDEAIVTASDLLRVVVCEINRYMHSPHSDLSLTPQQKFLDELPKQDGHPVLPSLVKDPRAFMLDFIPRANSKNTPTGIHWKKQRYYSDDLLGTPIGKKLTFIPNYSNSGSILVLLPDRTVEVERKTNVTYEDVSFETALRHAKRAKSREPAMVDQVEKSEATRDETLRVARLLKRRAEQGLVSSTGLSFGTTDSVERVASSGKRDRNALEFEFSATVPNYPVD